VAARTRCARPGSHTPTREVLPSMLGHLSVSGRVEESKKETNRTKFIFILFKTKSLTLSKKELLMKMGEETIYSSKNHFKSLITVFLFISKHHHNA
jgi:hypothetical protein